MPDSIWLFIAAVLYFTGLTLITRRAKHVQASQEDQAHNPCGERACNHQGPATSTMCGLWQTCDEHGSMGCGAHSSSKPRWADDDPELWALAQKLQSKSWGQARSSYATENISSK